MQKLSAALLDLANRVKRVEDSAAAVEAKNRAKLQARREELEAAIDESRIELAAAATQAKEATRSKWSEVKQSIEGQVDEMRADFAKWQAEIKEDRAERAAEDAAQDRADRALAAGGGARVRSVVGGVEPPDGVFVGPRVGVHQTAVTAADHREHPRGARRGKGVGRFENERARVPGAQRAGGVFPDHRGLGVRDRLVECDGGSVRDHRSALP